MPTLSVACTSTLSETTPTDAHLLDLTVSRSLSQKGRLRLLMKRIVNPHNTEHGAPDDEVRHVGDLGNFKTDGQGNAEGSVEDKFIKLIGSESVIGV
jgi:hypothetical protein